jgi:hypothetical protein
MTFSREFIDLIYDIALDPDNYPPAQHAKLKKRTVRYYWGKELVAKLDPIHGDPHFAIRIENMRGRRFGYNYVRMEEIFEGISGDMIISVASAYEGVYKFNVNFSTTPEDATPEEKAQIAYVISEVVDAFSN